MAVEKAFHGANTGAAREWTDARKEWIKGVDEDTYIDHEVDAISYKKFIDYELVQFSKYDVQRSVANIMDGLIPVKRKVLFCAFKRKLKNDIKVAQLAGYVSEHGAYHHGETSLEGAIVSMAQGK